MSNPFEEPEDSEEVNDTAETTITTEDFDPNYMGVRDRAMQFTSAIPGVTFATVDDWLDSVDKVEAKLTTGKRTKDE